MEQKKRIRGHDNTANERSARRDTALKEAGWKIVRIRVDPDTHTRFNAFKVAGGLDSLEALKKLLKTFFEKDAK